MMVNAADESQSFFLLIEQKRFYIDIQNLLSYIFITSEWEKKSSTQAVNLEKTKAGLAFWQIYSSINNCQVQPKKKHCLKI